MTNTYEKHIDTLRKHGARIAIPDGSIDLDLDFYHKAIEACKSMGCLAATYSLIVPGVEEPMLLAIHRNGHVDSGSEETVLACLDR